MYKEKIEEIASFRNSLILLITAANFMRSFATLNVPCRRRRKVNEVKNYRTCDKLFMQTSEFRCESRSTRSNVRIWFIQDN